MNSTLVATIQLKPKLSDVVNNLKNAIQFSYEAAKEGARIIVLPELCMSGNSLDKKNIIACMQIADGYQTNKFYEICRRYNCVIMFGYPELSMGEMYNSVMVVGPNGIIENYRKNNFSSKDYFWAKQSEVITMPIFIFGNIRVGVVIGNDLNDIIEKQKHYKKGTVDLICNPTSNNKLEFPEPKWMNLVKQLDVNVCISNNVFEDENGNTGGGSCLIDRKSKIWHDNYSLSRPTIVGGYIVT